MKKTASVNKLLQIIEHTIKVRNARYDDEVDMPKGPLFSVLIGSGFSVTAGLSNVGHFILSLEEFKKDRNQNWNDIFDKTKGVSIADRNLSAPQLTDYYFSLIEDVLPLPQARHDFITAAVQWASSRRVQINIESILLASLLISSTGGNIPLDNRKSKRHWMGKAFARHVFTTNFDEVMPTTFYLGNAPVDILDNDNNASINLGAEYPTVIYLHGRHLHYKIRNTKYELHRSKKTSFEQDLFQEFRNVLRSTGLIVIGYAGAEDKVTQMIYDAVEDPESLPYGLWWSVYQDEKKSVHQEVREMIRSNDRCYFLEPGKDAEQLMRMIVRGVGINDGEVIGIWKKRLGVIGNEVNRFIERADYDFHKFHINLIQSLLFLDDDMMRKVYYEWNALSEHLFDYEDQNLIADILPPVGRVLIELGEFKEAEELYSKLLSLLKNRNELEKIANCYLDISFLRILKGVGKQAVPSIEEAQKVFKKIDSNVGLVQSTLLLARLDWINGQLNSAQRLTKKAQKLALASNYKLGQADSISMLGQLAYTAKDYVKALNYFEQAKQMHELDGDERLIINDLRGLAKASIKTGDLKSAKEFAELAMNMSLNCNNKREIAHSNLVLAKYLISSDQKKHAKTKLDFALKIFEEYKDDYGVKECKLTINELK